MSYSTIAEIAGSTSLLERVTAGVASEVSSGSTPGDTVFAPTWTSRRSWDLASTPGWSEAWESAVAGDVPDPGSDPGVITDGMILSRVQQLLAAYPLDEVTTP